MSIRVSLRETDASACEIPTDPSQHTVADLLAAVHAALALPEAVSEYDVVLLSHGHETPLGGGGAKPETLLQDLGIVGCGDERVVVSIKLKHLARAKLKARGIATEAQAVKVVERALPHPGFTARADELLPLVIASEMATARVCGLLLHAVYVGNLDRVEGWLRCGAPVNIDTDAFPQGPLAAAVHESNIPMCQLLLRYGARVDAVDQEGLTPLYRAISNARAPVARILLEHSADVNAGRDPQGRSPLLLAVDGGLEDLAIEMIGYNADVDVVDMSGQTALSMATDRSMSRLIKTLKARGAAEGSA